MSTPTTTRAKRLSGDERRAQLLNAAKRLVLREGGIDGFSLDAVGREAGVALSLPRHYFESSERLLALAVGEAAQEVVEPFLRRDPNLTFEERVRLYLDRLSPMWWGHSLWVRADSLHPDVRAGDLRRQLVSASLGRDWADLTPAEQLLGAGWIGFCTTATAEWIEQGCQDRETFVRVLVEGARRFGIGR